MAGRTLALDTDQSVGRSGMLATWASETARPSPGSEPGAPDGLRSAFYGRVSTEDHQDPETSRGWQLLRAQAITSGYGRVTAEFFDVGHSRVLPWTLSLPNTSSVQVQAGFGGGRWSPRSRAVGGVPGMMIGPAAATGIAGAENYVHTGQAAFGYSWRTPPNRSRRWTSSPSSRSESMIDSGTGRRSPALNRVR